jgi:hypothetical protein
MKDVVPPACLVLALLLFIAAFGVLVRDPPQPGMDLHRARVQGDEAYQEVLEAELAHRQRQRKLLIGGLFGLAVIVAAAGYVAMRPADSPE